MKKFSKSFLTKFSFVLATSLLLISCGGSNSGSESSNQVIKPIPNAKVVYVCVDGKADANGSSWETCTAKIQDAITKAQTENKDLWFLSGDYNLTETIVIENKDLKLYGGFKGIENELKDRKLNTNATIFSGNKKIRVLKTENLSDKSVLDGFVITQGELIGQGESGAGIHNTTSNILIKNVTFSKNISNYGGAISNEDSSPKLTNVSFIENNSYYGGAIYNNQSSPTIINASFSKNSTSDYGGAIFNNKSHPKIINATFSQNTARYSGSAIANDTSSSIIINSTFTKNTATSGSGAIYNRNSNPTIKNSILWSNGSIELDDQGSSTPVISDSMIEAGAMHNDKYNGTQDPKLSEAKTKIINGVTHIYYDLENGSFAIDKGENTDNTENTDMIGNKRIQGVKIDMGAVEKQDLLL